MKNPRKFTPKSKMSSYLPFEIQTQIIIKLPAKSMIRCKTVSKSWKSLIESSGFMTDYNVLQTGPHNLFIRYDDHTNQSEELKLVSILDNITFPQQKFVPTVPESFKLLDGKPRVVGSSHGLFCFYGEYMSGDSYPYIPSKLIVIWNPAINKSIALDDVGGYDSFYSLLGFGVCPDTFDPMIVKIDGQSGEDWTCEVFRLSEGVWTFPVSYPPGDSIKFLDHHVDVNGFMYWNAYDEEDMDHLIVSFDMKNEIFARIDDVPKSVASKYFGISKLRESLAVLEYNNEAVVQKQICAVWMMVGDGVHRLFTKLYTISTQDAILFETLGFKKCGKPIVGTTVDDHDGPVLLSVYEPHSKNIDSLGIYGAPCSLYVSSYTETLLLLDHPNNHGKPVPSRILD